MPRSVNHVASKAKRTRILKLTKGYYGARKNVWTVAKNTWEKGLTYAYRDRRNKKRTFRALWIQRINAAAHPRWYDCGHEWLYSFRGGQGGALSACCSCTKRMHQNHTDDWCIVG